MKLVTTAELIATTKRGQLFREFEPNIFKGDWLQFHKPCGEHDFFYVTVGPDVFNSGYYQTHGVPQGLLDAGGSPKHGGPSHVAIVNHGGRDGCFDDKRQWIVLDEHDVKLMVEQILTGEISGESFLVVPEDGA